MYKDKKILAVVIARAGSSMQGKNYRLLNGVPVVNYSVRAAQASKHLDHIIISTNCEHVRNAILPLLVDDSRTIFVKRPDELARPLSKNESALINSYYWCQHTNSFDADYIVNLQPTSPIRSEGLIDRCIESIVKADGDSLLTVNKLSPLMWKVTDGKATALYDYVNRPMKQQFQSSSYFNFDNGNIYITRRDVLLDCMCRLGDNPLLFEITNAEAMQIDTEEEFEIIEAIMKIKESKKRAAKQRHLPTEESVQSETSIY